MAGAAEDPNISSLPPDSLLGSSPLVPSTSRNRRGSIASGDSPLRARRSSLSTNQSPSQTLPLAAAASLNASMRAGSSGPANTLRDTVDSRRRSVIADLAIADDSLPPAVEVASGDRTEGMAESVKRIPSITSANAFGGAMSIDQNPLMDYSRRSVSGSPGLPPGMDPARQSMNTADPFHKRAPSVSEVHQQMEQEQEAQVNRLLLQIHQQQVRIDALERQLSASGLSATASTMTDSDMVSQHSLTPLSTPLANHMRPPPTPERAHSSGSASTTVASTLPAARLSPSLMPVVPQPRSGSPLGLSLNRRTSSRGSSRAASPGAMIVDRGRAGDTSEANDKRYWQAEAGNVKRENEMLKARIQELERQLKSGAAESTAPKNSSALAGESMNIDD